jgi:tape measure domain-containing protein
MSTKGVEYKLSLKDLFTSKIKKATSATEKLNKTVSGVRSSFSSFGSALGIGLGAAGIVSFGKSVLDSLVNYEYFSASLRTLMKGDSKAASALQGDLIKLASTSPFSVVEIQDASKQLIAYGFSASSVTKNISMLGDVASALKIPFSDIAYLYGTLKTQGRAYARDIMQFTNRGIPIISELAKQFKVTDGEVMKLVSDGKVGFKDIEKAFKSLTSEGGQFFGMMDAQSQTVGGQLSNMGDNWEQLKVKIGQSQTGIIAGTVNMINSMIGNLNRGIDATNLLEQAFSKTHTKGFGWYDKMASGTRKMLGMSQREGSAGDLKSYAGGMKQNLLDNASDKQSANKNIGTLTRIMSNLIRGGYTKNEKYISVLKELVSRNKDKLALYSKTGGEVTDSEAIAGKGKRKGKGYID